MPIPIDTPILTQTNNVKVRVGKSWDNFHFWVNYCILLIPTCISSTYTFSFYCMPFIFVGCCLCFGIRWLLEVSSTWMPFHSYIRSIFSTNTAMYKSHVKVALETVRAVVNVVSLWIDSHLVFFPPLSVALCVTLTYNQLQYLVVEIYLFI